MGRVRAFGAEGTGSYGAGLARSLRGEGRAVLEVGRPDPRLRRLRGKADHLDAEAAARAMLAGQATAVPKSGAGEAEMIRRPKGARDTAVKARTQAMLALKAVIVGAPAALRDQLDGIAGETALARHLASLRLGPVTSTTASAKASLRAIARRWLALDAEVRTHDVHLDALAAARAPALVAVHGMGAGTAAGMPILVGDTPERIRSEAAFATLCGACPAPASSGRTTRHRRNRGGHRQADAALHRVVATRTRSHRPTTDYVSRRTREGETKAAIMRCPKRVVAREIFGCLYASAKAAKPSPTAA